MQLGLETFSYHLAFAYGKMNVFDFIERSNKIGLNGVQINVEGDNFGHLGSDDSSFLKDVRQCVEGFGLFIELDTCGTDPEYLSKLIKICRQVGADRLRTFASLGGDVTMEFKKGQARFSQSDVSLC